MDGLVRLKLTLLASSDDEVAATPAISRLFGGSGCSTENPEFSVLITQIIPWGSYKISTMTSPENAF